MGMVKRSERTYTSPLRAQQAANTRTAVLAAAHELFIAQGYRATTIDQIAERAGVSKPTVFTAVGNKQTVLAAVRDVAMAGDDEQVSVAERPLAQQVLAEPDPFSAVDLLAELITGINRRYARIDDVLRGAAQSGEPGLRELWQTSEDQRLIGARLWATSLADKAALRPELDLDVATDVLWFYMAPDHYHRMVHQRGWSDRHYRMWLARTLSRSLFAGDRA